MSSALAELTRIARLQQDLDDYWASARKGVPCLETSLKMLETLTLEPLLEPKTLLEEFQESVATSPWDFLPQGEMVIHAEAPNGTPMPCTVHLKQARKRN